MNDDHQHHNQYHQCRHPTWHFLPSVSKLVSFFWVTKGGLVMEVSCTVCQSQYQLMNLDGGEFFSRIWPSVLQWFDHQLSNLSGVSHHFGEMLAWKSGPYFFLFRHPKSHFWQSKMRTFAKSERFDHWWFDHQLSNPSTLLHVWWWWQWYKSYRW